ncbi:MAG: guanylate kinase [Candidatus Aegiribacteria sp.]|nr:guanylate kinase [Candidatus Aegiribacteria sp.]MBD3294037.1 guanylate kinase [Candidatus Fermentibacteria bacterium]
MSSSRTGSVFVISGPSGAGKTTLAHHLVQNFDSAEFSVSYTTREPRGSEVHGRDYFFVDEGQFEKMEEEGMFLEHAEVHGHLYGTSRKWLQERIASGKNVVLDIDVQGALQVRTLLPSAVLIFVLPPDRKVLAERLTSRNTDKADTVEKRMKAAAWETGWIGYFDFFICNDELQDSLDQIETVFLSQRLRLDAITFPRQILTLEPDRFSGLEYWKGKKVVVTSGSTREPFDDVRFISNRSSGRMGSRMAESLHDSGAEVLFVSGPACFRARRSDGNIEVETADEMLDVLLREIPSADCLVMCAAVSDFTPENSVCGKMERSGTVSLDLQPTPDILQTLVDRIDNICPVLAFALEFGEESIARAKRKMLRKGASAIFCNPGDSAGCGMESLSNLGTLIFKDGSSETFPPASKKYIAHLIASSFGRHLMKENDE